MEERNTLSEDTAKWTDNKVTIKTFDSWSLSLYRKQKRLMIETTDYHACPLDNYKR